MPHHGSCQLRPIEQLSLATGIDPSRGYTATVTSGMNMNRPIHQHFIPKFLLKNFCNDAGILNVYDKQENKIFKSNPQGIFKKRNLNTIRKLESLSPIQDSPGVLVEMYEDFKIEYMFSEMESAASPLIRKLLMQSRTEDRITLLPDEYLQVKRLLLLIDRRTPEAQERQSTGADVPIELFDSVVETIQKSPELEGVPMDTTHISRKIQTMVKDNIRAEFAAGIYSDEVELQEQYIRTWGLSTAVLDLEHRSFVIGSHGWSILDNGTRWFPIAPDVVVAGEPRDSEGVVHKFGRPNDGLVREINMASFQRSRFVAADNSQIICALKKRWRKVRS